MQSNKLYLYDIMKIKKKRVPLIDYKNFKNYKNQILEFFMAYTDLVQILDLYTYKVRFMGRIQWYSLDVNKKCKLF